MTKYTNPVFIWLFQLPVIARNIMYRDAVMQAKTMAESLAAFWDYHDNHPHRGGRRDLPI
ncbi:hypothetical protein [Cardiobacterium hominis]|jgi:hypothetical protein|uniref:hypothetical protein n=1 Tax=Cardiobacterium hominis TaxID=2718 RepID=UPI00288BD670|nr:hypothetical protein [Cardiobacterium hominis]